MSVGLACESAAKFLNNFRFTQHGFTILTKHGNKDCCALEILKKIWTCLTFIQLYILYSGMLLYLLHHRNSKLILHPAKFDNFKDEKNSHYYKSFFFFPNLIIDFKQELSPSKSLLYSTQLPILSPLIVSSIQGSYEK